MKINLILYSREDCHLCEDMIIELQAVKQKYNFNLDVIDIDKDEIYLLKYNLLVPLLCFHQQKNIIEICKYFFDPKALELFFQKNQLT